MDFRLTITNIPDKEFQKFYSNIIDFVKKEGSELPEYTNRVVQIDFNRLIELDQLDCLSDILGAVLATESMIRLADKLQDGE